MIKITLNIENFEKLKNGTYNDTKKTNVLKPVIAAAGVGVLAGTLLELASRADTKIGKTAKLLKELVRIFSN
jgi:type III secretion system FlhB-like substrate exporter